VYVCVYIHCVYVCVCVLLPTPIALPHHYERVHICVCVVACCERICAFVRLCMCVCLYIQYLSFLPAPVALPHHYVHAFVWL